MAYIPILQQTSNLLRLYVHQCGKSETPDNYHLWCCIALVAAAVGDHTYYTKFKHSKLYPNLYTLLVGPSGSGKDLAIGIALSFLKRLPIVKLYAGRATAPYIIDFMAKSADGKPPLGHSRMFLVTPELAMAVGSGNMADEFVKLTTALYGGADYPLTEGTRTSGTHIILNPCLNFLGGTTEEWMMRALTRDAIEGGFFARVAAVKGEYDFANRVVDPVYPPDYEDVVDHLHKRIKLLSMISGEFAMAPDAKRIEEQWYMAREVPQDDALIPSWFRQHAMILKLAMILSLMDNTTYTPESFVIELHHLRRAQQLANNLHFTLPYFINLSTKSDETKWIYTVTRVLMKAGRIQRYKLMQMCSGRGIDRVKLDFCVEQLIHERKLGRSTLNGTSSGILYTWLANKKKMPQAVGDD
ncbi:MAG TPA: DUF3987 domain-containing protein, partial [Candidatus Paceibacterota bacterium]